MSLQRILALSSSRSGNTGYLQSALPLIKNFLGDKPLRVAFIPFASVDKNYDEYALNVTTALSSLTHVITTVGHHNAKNIIEQADVIMVGGGNTFKLLRDIYQARILDVIRNKVINGTPYIGWSAGSNITGLTLCTTNDMPIIQPESFDALSFLPFQINPHYINQKFEAHNGETRDQRLEEFIKMNPGVPVICLPEGTALLLYSDHLTLIGDCPGMLMHGNEHAVSRKEIASGSDISFLLKG